MSINRDSTGVYRRAQYFRKDLSVSKGAGPVWQRATVTTSGGGSNPAGHVFIPQTPQNFTHDTDGSLMGFSNPSIGR